MYLLHSDYRQLGRLWCFFCMRLLVTSANAPTSLEYGASGDMVFLVPSVWRVRRFFFVYICSYFYC